MKRFFYRQKQKLRFVAIVLFATVSLNYADNYFEISKNLEIYAALYRELNAFYVDDTNPGELMKTGIDAMLKSLDPYTVYYPESKIEDFQFMTTGQYGGIGSLITVKDEYTVIAEPYEGSPAQRAGLMAGDKIYEVDGKSVAGMKRDEVSKLLKGQSGTSVKVLVERPFKEGRFEVTFDREKIQVPDVPYSGMLTDDVGYVRLSSFTATASQSLKKAMVKLKEENAQKLILDLRGNGGGLLREAVNIVNFFVGKGQEVVSTRGKREDWNATYRALNAPFDKDIPLIVLTDGLSASASEIVSGALQDLDRAVIVGDTTFGKGLVQQTRDLYYNSKLKVTVAKYYIPSGRCIQRINYSDKGKDGKASKVSNGDIVTFETKNGRPVFDGKGIAPDVTVDDEGVSEVLKALVREYIIFDYATVYRGKNTEIGDAELFSLTNREYEDFENYVLYRDFNYETRTEKILEKLIESAKNDNRYEDVKTTLLSLENQLVSKKEKDLMKFKSQIKHYLENEIISRYYYQKGRIQANLNSDPMVEKALEIFNTDYTQILQGK